MRFGYTKLAGSASEVCNSHCMAGVVYFQAFIIFSSLCLLLLNSTRSVALLIVRCWSSLSLLFLLFIHINIYVLLVKLTKYVVILHAIALLQNKVRERERKKQGFMYDLQAKWLRRSDSKQHCNMLQ